MRKTTFVLAALLCCTTTAFAQRAPRAGAAVDIPKTEAKTPAEWVESIKDQINPSTLKGIPYVYVINGTGHDLTSLACDGRYELIGPSSDKAVHDVNQRLVVLKAWTIALISTNKFDGYCKKSLMATSDRGDEYPTKLVSPDGTFSNALYITIMP